MEFKLKTKINTTAKEIYSSWLSREGHSKMTGGTASISDKIGDDFTAWDGYIDGVNLLLEPNKRIVQSWRTIEFTDSEESSKLEVLLVQKNDQTEL